MTYCFPVAETADNLIWFSLGNLVVVPPTAANAPIQAGKVIKRALGNPGGAMLVTIEPIPADRSAG